MQYDFHEHVKDFQKHSFDRFVLAADIGATNSRFGMVGFQKSSSALIFQLRFDSASLPNLIPAMNETLRFAKEKYDIETDSASFGIPGQVSTDRSFAEPTNLNWGRISASDILNNSFLSRVTLLNDFEALAFGLECLDPTNPAHLVPTEHLYHYQPDPVKYGVKMVLGAGSGLGESFLVFDPHHKRYVPCPSEGGHASLPTQSPLELEFEEFVQKELKSKKIAVTYEHAVSGPGLVRIFNFLKTQRGFKPSQKTQQVDEAKDKPPLIVEFASTDSTCKKALDLFLYFFAKCAQNKALDFLPLGGLYLAGGIPQHNPNLFSNGFMLNFEQGSNKSVLLREIPIFLITYPHAALVGASSVAVNFPHYAVRK